MSTRKPPRRNPASSPLRVRHGGLAALAAAALLAACSSPAPEERLARASEQFARGDYALASIELRNVLQEVPDLVEARLLLGLTAQRLGDLPAAEEHLSRARALGAAPEDYALPLAAVLTELRRSPTALRVLDDVAEDARDAEWHAARGQAQLADDQREAARRSFERALALDEGHYGATLGLARLAAAENDPAGARSFADRAVRLAPERAEAFLLIGTLQLAGGSLAAAAETFETAARLEAGGVSATVLELNARLALAQIHLARNDLPALVETRNLLTARAPEAPVTQYIAAAVHHLQGEYREAGLLLQQLGELGQDNPQIQLLAGANNLALGTYVQAEQALLRVLAMQPGQPNALRLLAESRRRQGRPRAALDVLQAFPDDGDPRLLALRGELHLEDGNPTAAIAELERASAAGPRQPAVQLQLARAYLAAGRDEEAVALFRGQLGEALGPAIETALALLTAYVDSRDLDAARGQAEARLAVPGDNALEAFGVGLFHQATGDAAAARRALRESLVRDPDLAEARLTLAGLALAEADGEAARAEYRALLARDPANVAALLGLAQLDQQSGALDEAAAHLQAAIAADPGNIAPRLALVRLALARDDLATARRVVDQAATSHPANPEVATLDGLLRFREGRSQAAVGAFRAAADRDPERAQRWLNLARAQAASGDLGGAQASLRRARSLAPRAPQVLLTAAQVELELGNLDAARGFARELQAAAPASAQGFGVEAEVSAREGDARDADRLFVSAYEREPAFETAFRSFQARREAGFPEPAALLARWLQVRPEDVQARLLVAQTLQDEGSLAPALRQYEQALRRDPDNVVALNNAAWLLGETGEPARGLDYSRRAVAIAPELAPVLDTHGWLLVQSGRVAEGLEYLQRAVQRAPRAPDLRFHLGSAQAKAGQTQAARATLGRLLNEHPDYARREEVAGLLAGLQD